MLHLPVRSAQVSSGLGTGHRAVQSRQSSGQTVRAGQIVSQVPEDTNQLFLHTTQHLRCCGPHNTASAVLTCQYAYWWMNAMCAASLSEFHDNGQL